MIEISAKEARSKLSHLLDWVEKGEELAITRRVAQIGDALGFMLFFLTREKPDTITRTRIV